MSYFDLTATANDVLARLGAASWLDLNWATQAEVFGYFDEANQRLGELGLFVYSETLAVIGSTAQYPMSALWLDSIHVSVDGSQLRPASLAELIALDSTWPQLECDPNQVPGRYSMDAGPLGTIALYPIPANATGVLTSVDHIVAPPISTAQTLAPVPSVVSDYYLYFALMRLRGKESPYAMPELVQAAAAQCRLYEQVFTAYFGGAQ